MKRLTLAEKRALGQALPQSTKLAMRKYCRECQMKGEGISDILKKIGNFFGPIVKAVGPTILKEILVPLTKKQLGLGLKLAGQGKPPRKCPQTKQGQCPKKRPVRRIKKKS